MKIPVAILSLAMAVGLASCGGTNPPPQNADNNQIRSDTGGNGTAAPEGAGPLSRTVATARMEGEAPSADAQFTLFCDAIRGPNHVMVATAIKDRLISQTGLRSWHILHTNEQSALFYGYYRTFTDKEHDPQEFARAQADLHRIEALKNADGDRLFKTAMFLPINNPDPDAPPQWNLVNTPATAYWSLQIAAYQGSPERKKYALEAVKGLRSQGVEAYYYHGETISSVCVGAWPREAVKSQDKASGSTTDPNAILMVVSGPLPPNTSPEMVDKAGNRVTIEAPKLEILDSRMAKAIRDYPEHAVNGEVMVKTARNGQKIPSPSFLVLIPHSDAPPAPMIPLPPAKLTASHGADQAADAILDVPQNQPGRGQLRSLDH